MIAHGDTILLSMSSFPDDTSATGAIFRSTNGGATWIESYVQGRALGLANASGAIYAAVTAGVIRSTDWGVTWSPFNNALPTTSLSGIVAHPGGDTVFASTTTHGVLKVWRFTTGLNDDQLFNPRRFALHQNYPNPFNPSTTLLFDIHHSSFVILKVCDILGREVAKVVNEQKEAGTYRVEFHAGGLPSGVYLYRLQAGGYTTSRLMVLIR